MTHYRVADIQKWVNVTCQRCPGLANKGEEFTLVLQVAMEWEESKLHTVEDLLQVKETADSLDSLSQAAREVLKTAISFVSVEAMEEQP